MALSCCGRRKTVRQSDEDPIMDLPRENDDYTYTHTDELTNPDTTGLSSDPADKRNPNLMEECREVYGRLSLSTWWTRTTKPTRSQEKHVPPPIDVGTPRTPNQERWTLGWPKKNEDDSVQGAKAKQRVGSWMDILPVTFGEQKPSADASATHVVANDPSAQRRLLHPPPAAASSTPHSSRPASRPRQAQGTPLASPAQRRPVSMSTADPGQGGGKAVKSKISEKELQEVTSRIGELKRSGLIDTTLEGSLYQKVSARDPHLFMAWTVYQCNGDENKFLAALKALR